MTRGERERRRREKRGHARQRNLAPLASPCLPGPTCVRPFSFRCTMRRATWAIVTPVWCDQCHTRRCPHTGGQGAVAAPRPCGYPRGYANVAAITRGRKVSTCALPPPAPRAARPRGPDAATTSSRRSQACPRPSAARATRARRRARLTRQPRTHSSRSSSRTNTPVARRPGATCVGLAGRHRYGASCFQPQPPPSPSAYSPWNFSFSCLAAARAAASRAAFSAARR